MTILEVQHLNKIYPDGTEALQDVSFRIEKGESVIILGHNGSGKSTMFRCITAFEKPTKGDIRIFDTSIHHKSKRELRPVRKRIGMVFQHFNLVHNISVFQNVLFGALGNVRFSFQTFSPIASEELRLKAMNCLERVGLAHLAMRRADQLSGGQQQRIAIARMLMQDPEIILADEPIASLDPKAGREVMDLLWSIAEERNLTVIAILHQLEIAKQYGERIIALKAGKKILDVRKSELSRELSSSIFDGSLYENDVARIGGEMYESLVQ